MKNKIHIHMEATIAQVKPEDLETLLAVQNLSYAEEVKAWKTEHIPPIEQTLDDLNVDFAKGPFLKAMDENGMIIGSIRGYKKDDTVYLSRLFVHPLYQDRGIGHQLLSYIERMYPDSRFEICATCHSSQKLALYEKLGYLPYKEEAITPTLILVYFEKYN